MSDQIFLRAMEFTGRHGVSDDERADEQLIEVDIVLDVDLRAAGRSDDLADTVSSQGVLALIRLPGVDPEAILRGAGASGSGTAPAPCSSR